MKNQRQPASKIIAYTDAAYHDPSGVGGWAFVAIEGKHIHPYCGNVLAGKFLNAGAIGMELFAIHQLIEWAGANRRLLVWSDCEALVNLITGDHTQRNMALKRLIQFTNAKAQKLKIEVNLKFIPRNANVFAAYADHMAGMRSKGYAITRFDHFRADWKQPKPDWDIAPEY